MLLSHMSAPTVARDQSDDDLQKIGDGLRVLEHSPRDQRARSDVYEAARHLGLFDQAATFQPVVDVQRQRQQEGDRMALQIRYGVIDRDSMCGPRRFYRLDAAIAATDALADRFFAGDAPDGENLRRLGDRVSALAARHRHADAIRLYGAITQRGYEVPVWVMRDVAESYLDQHEARASAELYRQVLARQPDDFQANVGLFYALSDMNDYPAAMHFIDTYAAGLPQRRHLDNKYNGERLSADVLADRARMDAGLLDEAQQRITSRLSWSPHNQEVRQAMASLALARGWPRAALQIQQGVASYAPCDANVRGDLSETALATQDWMQARAALKSAQWLDPGASSVRRAEASMALHDDFELSVDANYEHSPTNNSHASGYFGSDDWNAHTFLYSPPIAERWRWFLHDYTAMADFSGSWTSWRRDGAGIDWRWLNWGLAAEVNGGNVGGAGGIVSLRWEPNDHWDLDAKASYRTNDIPLKAVSDGTYANDVTIGAGWQGNESSSLSARSTLSHFTDGNQRTSLSMQWEQRWISNASWQVSSLLGVSGSHNSSTAPVSYFNPRRDHDVMLTGMGDYITWRNYDYRFTQRLEAGLGRYWQYGYPSGAITYLRYGHDWQLGRSVEWRYGVAIVMRPYDGVRETQIRADMHLLWRF